MKALQIIPPNPATKVRRSVFRFHLSDAIILLALAAGMSMSRGQEGIASEPGVAVTTNESRDETSQNDGSAQAAAAAATATKDGSRDGSSDEKAPVSPQPNGLPAAAIEGSPKVGEGETPAAAEPRPDTAATNAIKNGEKQDSDSNRTLAKRPANSQASVASRNDPSPRLDDVRRRKAARNPVAARSPEPVRSVHRSRGAVDYRSWRSKSADGAPVWVGPPPVIYAARPEAMAPFNVDGVDGMKRQDRMPSAKPGILERVVNVPGAVLDSGKHAFYGILDSVW